MAYILLLSLIGLGISLYILFRKNKRQTILCIIGKDCNEVITSKYSSFFGLRNELLGTAYYLFTILSSMYLSKEIGSDNTFGLALTLASLVAALYSIYLTNVQIAILKKICGLCLITNFLNLLIFIIILFDFF